MQDLLGLDNKYNLRTNQRASPPNLRAVQPAPVASTLAHFLIAMATLARTLHFLSSGPFSAVRKRVLNADKQFLHQRSREL